MSSADAFVSSPLRPSRFDPYTLSSSPNLPSITDILKKDPTESRLQHAAPASNARTVFTSAANILREAPEIDIETEQITKSPSPKPNPKKSRKKKALQLESVKAFPETPILIESSPKEKPWQKFKSKKKGQENGKATTSEVTVMKSTIKGKREKSETVSRHFATAKGTTKHPADELEKSKIIHKSEDQTADGPFFSETALTRRHDWTPPRANSPIFLGSESDNQELLSSVDRGVKSKDVFESLQDRYAHRDVPSSAAQGQSQQVDILKKRKLIELVSVSHEVDQHSREPSPPKAIVTKKKTRTITELATAPYMPPIGPDLDVAGPITKESLLNYFDSDGAVKALVEHQTAVMSYKKGKVKETKAAKPKRKKKSGTVENPILLSPNSALKQSRNQDFVFGTSSQLVGEESPTTLKDLQRAIQASNRVDSDPFADSDGQGLWHAGARDVDGDLMKGDQIDLVEDFTILPRIEGQMRRSREEFVDIDDILKSSGIDDSAKITPQEKTTLVQSQAPAPAPAPDPAPSDAKSRQSDRKESAESQSADVLVIARPDYDLLSDAQLSAQIASYGFKPVKKRQAMIALLDRCWLNKNAGASTSLSISISTSASMSAPKRKQAPITEPEKAPKQRGRPKKSSTTETSSTGKALAANEASPKSARGGSRKNATEETSATAKATIRKDGSPSRARGRPRKVASKVVEISNSDTDDHASSLSSRGSSPDRDGIFSSPPAVDLSISEDVDMSLTLSPTDQQADLFNHITRAVTSMPHSDDPLQPSWYEKMLLYDPIVLEDLSAWLNGPDGLGKTGYDAEVSPFVVKKWCESKSVICLWRCNMSGKERKRF
ncbi:hypothetical protein GGR54DRAFT_601016 [Hypoxylon sp. NC1633]|nr:hypothetical protein GGR54DRAFT_601016 [Hypoxylon sp. NC1633]